MNRKLKTNGGRRQTAAWLLTVSLLLGGVFQANAAKEWIDMSDEYFGDDDWSVYSWASFRYQSDCYEFRNGDFYLWRYLNGLTKGHYRLSVQGFYRVGAIANAYKKHLAGTEEEGALLFAADYEKSLVSEFSDSLDYNPGLDYWTPNETFFFPGGLQSAADCFSKGMFVNQLEFDAEGNTSVGVWKFNDKSSDWCVLHNFKLEYYGEMVLANSISLQLPTTELVYGQHIVAEVTLLPENVLKHKLLWETSNAEVVSVYEGWITAVGEGQADITVKTTDGSNLSSKVTVTVTRNPAEPGSLVINEVMASNVDQYISPAYNFDGWIELYNPTDKGVEMGGLWLSDDKDNLHKWKMPMEGDVIGAKDYSAIWFDSNDLYGRNAPFKLDLDGGTVLISNDAGQLIASVDYPAGMERVSYARTTDGGDTWALTSTPTLFAKNDTAAFAMQQLEAPVVDQPSQLFKGTLAVSVAIPSGCTLRYTTNGTLPDENNGEISETGKFTVNKTTCYRFRLFAKDKLASTVTTRSYIMRDKNYTLPVLSVVTDPAFLYDNEIGVYVEGWNGRPGNGKEYDCNWNMDWERPVNFSYLDAEGKMVFNQDANLEICGGWSRAWSPRSFKLKGNKELGGNKNLPYPFFDQKPYIRNRTLQIRNGGNDTSCRFKDPALQYIVQSSGIDLDCQSYQPVHEFLNDEYVGVLNMREPNNKHYVYANYGWDDDEIDQFEMSPDSGYVQKCGTPEAFDELVDVLSPDAANSETYAEICRMLDIDEYINYMALELYLGSDDWPKNNIKGFRHRDNGKFRFVVFDLDHAFNTSSPFNLFMSRERWQFDVLYPSYTRITAQIKFVTLFKNLLANADFRRQFIDTFCLMGGSVFQTARVKTIVDELAARVNPAMTLEGRSVTSTASSIKQNLSTRTTSQTSALRNYTPFGLSRTTAQSVTLESDTEGAQLFINGLRVPTGYFKGRLFAPVLFKAVAPAGYVFQGWKSGTGDNAEIISEKDTLSMPTGTLNLKATFRPMTDAERLKAGVHPVCVNEVSASNSIYVNSYWKKNDWVELCNNTDEEIDIEGMYLTDNLEKPEKYMITSGNTRASTKISARGKMIIWCDNLETTDTELHASFKLSGQGGVVALTAADRSWTDVLSYDEHDGNTTVGRFPDGGNAVYAMNVPTIGQPNVLSSYAKPVLQQNGDDTAVMTLALDDEFRIRYGSGLLIVKGGDVATALVEVFTPDGRLVKSSSVALHGGSTRVSVADLPAGCYVARASYGEGCTATCKFLK